MGLGDIIHKAEKTIQDGEAKIVDEAKKSIGEIKTQANKAKKVVSQDVKKVENVISTGVKKLPDNLSKAGGFLEKAVLSAGNTIGTLEDQILPSSNKIIMETGLVVAGIAAVCIVLVKFV